MQQVQATLFLLWAMCGLHVLNTLALHRAQAGNAGPRGGAWKLLGGGQAIGLLRRAGSPEILSL